MELPLNDIVDLLERIFQGPIPKSVLWALFVVILFILLLRSVSYLHREIIPIFYNADKVRRRNRRRRFAEDIEDKLDELNKSDFWSDDQFTELEAEIEAEGRRRHPLLPFLTRRDSLRREASLTKALENSTERLIHLEGTPGSGKSVALRHIALMMSRRAARSRSVTTIIPLYINLKSLKREKDLEHELPVDAQFIHNFVLQSLNRGNNQAVKSFLDEEFQLGLNEGTWMFLFDSFDEIPEILSSTEADRTIQLYAQAISDFLHGLNKCRGIIASREYRGPQYLSWSKFRILPLSMGQQEKLIKRTELPLEDETRLIGGLWAGSQGTRQLTENPMFLRLLCEYVRENHRYPEHDYAVYEEFITKRFTSDQERLKQRFGLSIADVRKAAENIAFCMLLDPTLGLSAKRPEIALSLSKHGLLLGADTYLILDALQFIKLAKIEDNSAELLQRDFSFSHRRLQEHLATKVLLRETDRVPSADLLTNGVWRESTVVLLQQTQSAEDLEPLIQTGVVILNSLLNEISTKDDSGPHNLVTDADEPVLGPQPFPWPHGLLHVMGLLQDGLADRPSLVPYVLRTIYSQVITTVWDQDEWLIFDMEDALSVASLLPQDVLGIVLSEGLTHPSRRIRDMAYRKAATLKDLQLVHVQAIRSSLVEMYKEGRIRREQKAMIALLMRLEESNHLLDVLRFLNAIPYLDLVTVVLVTWLWSFALLAALQVSPSLLLQLLPGLSIGLIYLLDTVGSNRWAQSTIFAIGLVAGCFLVPIMYFQSLYGSYIGAIFYAAMAFGPGIMVSKLWRASALSMVKDGILVAPRQWPIVPIYALIRYPAQLLKITPEVAITVWAGIKKIWTRFISKPHLFRRIIRLIVTCALWGSIIAVMIAALWAVTSDRVPESLRLAIMLIISIPLYAFVTIDLVIPALKSTAKSRKRRQLFKTTSTRTEKLDMDEFLKATAELDSEYHATSYIRLIGKRDLLNKTPENSILLEKLASQLQFDLQIDRGQPRLPSTPLVSTGEDDIFVNWYNDYIDVRRWSNKKGRYHYGLANLGWDFLDEIKFLRKLVEEKH